MSKQRTKKNDTSRQHLTNDEISEIALLYEEKGWKILWIAKKLNVSHSAVLSLIDSKKLIRQKEVLTQKPPEVEFAYRKRLREEKHLLDEEDDDFLNFNFNDETIQVKSYATIIREATRRKSHTPDTECSHTFWQQRCSLCGQIMSSDMQTLCVPCSEPIKLVYNELDSLVCTYRVSLELQKLGVKQLSALYWIFYDSRNTLVLRLNGNLPDKQDDNALIASAFTSQELFKLLLKVDESSKNENFDKKVIENGDNPTYLGKLLCRCIRKENRKQ